MVGQVFFFFFVFFLSFSSFRFPLHGLLYTWMDHTYLLSDYQRSKIGNQELRVSIGFDKKNEKEEMVGQVFFLFFHSFSSFWFSSHFLDSFITGWNTFLQPETPEGSQETDGKYVQRYSVAHCSVHLKTLLNSSYHWKQDILSIIDVLMFSQTWSMVICGDSMLTEILAFSLLPSLAIGV